MGRGGHCAGDGDVGEGGQVVQGPAARLQFGRELAIPNARGERGGAGGLIDGDGGVEAIEGDQIAQGIGEGGERVARSERAQGSAARHEGLQLGGGLRVEEICRAVLVVAGPVGADAHRITSMWLRAAVRRGAVGVCGAAGVAGATVREPE